MRKMKLSLVLIFLLNLIAAENLVEDKYYIQLHPSVDKTQPYLSHFYNLNSKFITINSTDGENMEILNKKETMNETPIKKLSLVSKYNDFLIKTCFGPDKIVEIIDEKDDVLTPKDDYFKEVKKNLENIEYCYTTSIANIYNITEHVIITYWTESVASNGNKNYKHKSILFFPHNKTFSKIYSLDSKGKNYFAQSCTNLRNKYIYCNINQSLSLSNDHHFSVIPSFITKDQITILIRLVDVYPKNSISVYHKPIGTFKHFHSITGRYVEVFLLECHNKKSNKTMLVTSGYINYDLYSYINKNDDIEVYNGINIEDQYIDPNLFNSLVPNNQSLIITYIMKNYEGKNLLILNSYDYNEELKTKTKFDKFSSSNYLRGDICQNPKYMQSMFITSFINYNDDDIFEADKQYYKYQKDIATIISCDNGNGNVFYEAKKIQMPQCLNILNEINGMNDSFIFVKDYDEIVLNIEDDPNYKSLRDVEIEFQDSSYYDKLIMVVSIKNDVRTRIDKAMKLDTIQALKFLNSLNFRPGMTIKIPYKIKQTRASDTSLNCHLTSDLCYFQFHYEKPADAGEEKEECPFCNYPYEGKCLECQKDIIGLNKKVNECGCQCNVENGFDPEPDLYINMCLCKKGYSFYKNISQCLPNPVLNNTHYCTSRNDSISLISIYDDLKDGEAICYVNGIPRCCNESMPNSESITPSNTPSNTPSTSIQTTFTPIIPTDCTRNKWFSLGQYIFYYIKIEQCVYIFYDNTLKMYSNRSDCDYIEGYDYKECLGINLNNESDYYYVLNNAYEYKPDDDKDSLIIKENNITFYLLNNFTEKNFSSVQLSQKCIEKVKKGFNLPYLLIFIANIKQTNIISTQVEYSFYYSTPEYIYQELNISSYCYKSENNLNNTSKRSLEVEEQWKNNGNYSVDVDKILVNVQIDFNSEQGERIKELRDNNINIFNSSEDFYLDVCFKYKTPQNTDIYLQNRKEKYYIKDSICETSCRQLGYDDLTGRVICLCPIKGSTENFENVTFSPNVIDERFKKKYHFPNIRVVKCFLKLHWKELNIGLLISTFLIILYFIGLIWGLCKITFKNKHEIQTRENDLKKIIYTWEEPYEILLQKITFPENDEDNNAISGDAEELDDENRKFRVPLEEPSKVQNKPEVPKNDIQNDKKPEINNINIHFKRDINNKKKPEKLKMFSGEGQQVISQNGESEISDKKSKEKETEKETTNENDILNINQELQIKNKLIIIGDKDDDDKEKMDKISRQISKYTDSDKQSKNTEEIIHKKDYSIDSEEKTSSIGGDVPYEENSSQKNEDNNDEKEIKINSESGKKKSNKNKTKHLAEPPQKVLSTTPRIKLSNNTDDNFYNNNLLLDVDKEEMMLQDKRYKKWITYKYPHECGNDSFSLFFYKFFRDNTICFVLPLYPMTDRNGAFIKILVLVLYLSCYMCFNILIEFDLTTLHLTIPNDKYTDSKALGGFVNCLFPLIVYCFIYYFKKYLSIREFYLEEFDRIYDLKKRKRDKKMSNNEFCIRIKTEKTRIKKARNNSWNSIKIISILAFIILIINWYLVTCFCGIYNNSLGCIAKNILINIFFNIIIACIIHIIEILCRKDIKPYIFKLCIPYMCGCWFTLFFYCSGCKFYEEISDVDSDIKDKDNNNNQNHEHNQDTNQRLGVVTNQIYPE